MCVCERERERKKERKRERLRQREGKREKDNRFIRGSHLAAFNTRSFNSGDLGEGEVGH